MLSSLYQRYRGWEDGYLQLLDDLNAGRDPGPHWQATAMRRMMIRGLRKNAPGELVQLRDFIWRWRGWRGWAATLGALALCSGIGLLAHWAKPEKFGALEGVVLANLLILGVGLGMVSLWFNPGRLQGRYGRTAITAVVMTVLGGLFGAVVMGLRRGDAPLEALSRIGPAVVAGSVVAGLAYLTVMMLITSLRNRELAALAARLKAEAEAQRLQQQATHAQLRLLQAQIEPHFLFNTLGAVQQLAETRAPEAAQLTAQLIRFLRGSMGAFRNDTSTLGAELDLADSYLRVMQSRLGRRLTFDLSAAEDLRGQPLPTTLLITLVENAIKHGIEPAPAGGHIGVRAWREGGALVLEVADTGVGMAELPGSGQGLSNLREQLRLRHGQGASLELFDNDPAGLVARLSLPLETAE